MALSIKWNDAWESVPLAYANEIADRIRSDLQPSHPLHRIDFLPVAKLWSAKPSNPENYIPRSRDSTLVEKARE